jgi:hypothetical protein
VLKVVKAMNGDKAPGLDSFSITFFQACWVVLKEDIMKVVCNFHASGKFERSLDATFIALIMKVPKVIDPMDFHLINLVGVICKIIEKIPTNRKIISK